MPVSRERYSRLLPKQRFSSKHRMLFMVTYLHGFGLPCAKELLRRNNAFYTMDYHDGAFQFCFEWPDVACNSCVHA